ncbi:hypothetical protein GCM10009612_62460 [Streptomyces beijiangensis]
MLTALALLALLVVSALGLVLSGPIAEDLGRRLHLDAAVALIWTFARWSSSSSTLAPPRHAETTTACPAASWPPPCG